MRKQHTFCNLPSEALLQLDLIKKVRTFESGERLFTEGQSVDDLMIVCEGAAMLTFASPQGHVMMLGLSEAGEVLGLSSALSGHHHETTANALVNTRVATISRSDFLDFVEQFPVVSRSVGVELSRKVNRAYDKIRLIGAGLSVPQRIASWLIKMLESHGDGEGKIKLTLTHERIAQLLGISRESVTRTLSSLKRVGAIEVRGIHLYVRKGSHLRGMIKPEEHIRAQARAV